MSHNIVIYYMRLTGRLGLILVSRLNTEGIGIVASQPSLSSIPHGFTVVISFIRNALLE